MKYVVWALFYWKQGIAGIPENSKTIANDVSGHISGTICR